MVFFRSWIARLLTGTNRRLARAQPLTVDGRCTRLDPGGNATLRKKGIEPKSPFPQTCHGTLGNTTCSDEPHNFPGHPSRSLDSLYPRCFPGTKQFDSRCKRRTSGSHTKHSCRQPIARSRNHLLMHHDPPMNLLGAAWYSLYKPMDNEFYEKRCLY